MDDLEIQWAGPTDLAPLHHGKTDACVALYGANEAFTALKASIPKLEPQDWALYTHAVLARADGRPVGYALVDLDFHVKVPGTEVTQLRAADVELCANLKTWRVLDPDPERAAAIRRALLEFILREARAHGVTRFTVDRVYAEDEAWVACLRGLGFEVDATFHVMALATGA